MNRTSSRFLLTVAAIASLAPLAATAQTPLTHHVREVVKSGTAQLVGRLPSGQVMNLDIVLPIRDQAGLDGFLKDLYDPSSPSFHKYLTPAQFTAKFGPTQEDYAALQQFAVKSGFTITGGSRDGMELQVHAPVSAVESAFHVTMNTYQHPTENRVFFSADREPTPDVSFAVWHVSGLDNYSIPHTNLVKRSDYAAAHGISPDAVVSHATTGSGPSSSFLGSDMRAAYYGGTALTGAGQNLGLFEYLGTDLADLTTYFTNVKQTNNVPVTLVSTDGTSTACLYTKAGGDCDDGEQNLDMTQAIGMAPALSSLVMYIGSLDTAIISAMTTHSPLPTTIGCSWGWTPADASTLDPYFEKMSAQGQNFFAASGDSSTWSTKNEAWPADDAYVVSVGGTDLVTSSAAGPWKSETAWTDSGGGITPDKVAIPAYQQLSGVITTGNKGSTTLRNGPDVSANANFTFYTCGDQEACLANEYGGTSFAAPMWAGFIALVNQQLALYSEAPIGFINPTIYAQNVTAAKYAADFHDILTGTSGSYSATTGFDLVTGWGSPTAGLIAALAPSPAPSMVLSSTTTTMSVAVGATGTAPLTVTIGGGFSSSVTLSATGEPAKMLLSFKTNPIPAPGSASDTLTVMVEAKAKAGTYPIKVTATGGGITSSTTINVTIP